MNRDNPQPSPLASGISLEILDSGEGSTTKWKRACEGFTCKIFQWLKI